MELIKPGINIDFIGNRSIALAISGAMILASILVFAVRGGPNYGIDFAGGVMVHVRFKAPHSIGDIRQVLSGAGLGESAIQDFGVAGTEFLVRLPLEFAERKGVSEQLYGGLKEKFGADSFELMREERVGPRVGRELRQRAILAVLFATLMMGLYLWFRFDLRFGIGAAAALFHDVIITAGALAAVNYEFDLSIVAALLTIVGFSVNDTVIVSDRIRENMRKNRRDPLAVIVNRSINETLSRTILTTGTAVLVIVALFILGGNVIRAFSFALLVGFIVGTYSSMFIASPIVLLMERAPARSRR